jgi:hypothetical protein
MTIVGLSPWLALGMTRRRQVVYLPVIKGARKVIGTETSDWMSGIRRWNVYLVDPATLKQCRRQLLENKRKQYRHG